MEVQEKFNILKPEGELQTVSIHGSSQVITEGAVIIKSWSARERKLRAVKFLAGSWLIAIVTVFIPIAHFFLVPLFFAARSNYRPFCFEPEISNSWRLWSLPFLRQKF